MATFVDAGIPVHVNVLLVFVIVIEVVVQAPIDEKAVPAEPTLILALPA